MQTKLTGEIDIKIIINGTITHKEKTLIEDKLKQYLEYVNDALETIVPNIVKGEPILELEYLFNHNPEFMQHANNT